MPKEIKVAFSGARRASSFFNAFQSHPETEIVALCDPHAETLTEAYRNQGRGFGSFGFDTPTYCCGLLNRH